MTPLNKRALLPAALMALACDGAMAGDAVPHIRIECPGASTPQAPICDALRGAISARFPGHLVTASAAPAPDTGSTVLQLISEQPRRDEVLGRLVWTTADGRHGQSRALHLTVMDAVLTDEMLRDFGTQLATLFDPSI